MPHETSWDPTGSGAVDQQSAVVEEPRGVHFRV